MPISTHACATADDYLQIAVDSASSSQRSQILDAIPVPIYVTNAVGLVIACNAACAQFAGRDPQVGKDRWCVTWRMYTTSGDPLPHEQCPMADAIRLQRPIRDAIAIAMRPDGTRVAFRPYPTPLFDGAGELTGAVNMLIDVSNEQAPALADQADRCRRLSRATNDREVTLMLKSMAEGYDDTAAALRSNQARSG
ncbi:MAG: PAS domain-containing protein [Pseudomonadota bacterium]|nr:PAS domain-containing protein [Pseudomonadota bacterium]